jgi:hypothetical protein
MEKIQGNSFGLPRSPWWGSKAKHPQSFYQPSGISPAKRSPAPTVNNQLHSVGPNAPRTQVHEKVREQSRGPLDYKRAEGERRFRMRFGDPRITPDGNYAQRGSKNIHTMDSLDPEFLNTLGYYGIAAHEGEHAFHQKNNAAMAKAEIAPSLGDIVFMGQEFRDREGRPVEGNVTLPGNKVQNIDWMARQAAEHGYWDGISMQDLLRTPEGRRYLDQMGMEVPHATRSGANRDPGAGKVSRPPSEADFQEYLSVFDEEAALPNDGGYASTGENTPASTGIGRGRGPGGQATRPADPTFAGQPGTSPAPGIPRDNSVASTQQAGGMNIPRASHGEAYPPMASSPQQSLTESGFALTPAQAKSKKVAGGGQPSSPPDIEHKPTTSTTNTSRSENTNMASFNSNAFGGAGGPWWASGGYKPSATQVGNPGSGDLSQPSLSQHERRQRPHQRDYYGDVKSGNVMDYQKEEFARDLEEQKWLAKERYEADPNNASQINYSNYLDRRGQQMARKADAGEAAVKRGEGVIKRDPTSRTLPHGGSDLGARGNVTGGPYGSADAAFWKASKGALAEKREKANQKGRDDYARYKEKREAGEKSMKENLGISDPHLAKKNMSDLSVEYAKYNRNGGSMTPQEWFREAKQRRMIDSDVQKLIESNYGKIFDEDKFAPPMSSENSERQSDWDKVQSTIDQTGGRNPAREKIERRKEALQIHRRNQLAAEEDQRAQQRELMQMQMLYGMGPEAQAAYMNGINSTRAAMIQQHHDATQRGLDRDSNEKIENSKHTRESRDKAEDWFAQNIAPLVRDAVNTPEYIAQARRIMMSSPVELTDEMWNMVGGRSGSEGGNAADSAVRWRESIPGDASMQEVFSLTRKAFPNLSSNQIAEKVQEYNPSLRFSNPGEARDKLNTMLLQFREQATRSNDNYFLWDRNGFGEWQDKFTDHLARNEDMIDAIVAEIGEKEAINLIKKRANHSIVGWGIVSKKLQGLLNKLERRAGMDTESESTPKTDRSLYTPRIGESTPRTDRSLYTPRIGLYK